MLVGLNFGFLNLLELGIGTYLIENEKAFTKYCSQLGCIISTVKVG